MSKKEVFLNFIDELIKQSPKELVETMPEDAKIYLAALRENEENKTTIFTENGKMILKHLQTKSHLMQKAKNIAEDLGISSRSVSGSMRKLVNDGFVEKIGKDPILYQITEKGKNIEIN